MLEPLIDSDPSAIGRYRLAGRLGSGGMGTVYLGFDPARRPAAIKMVRPDLLGDTEFRDRFRREVEAARRVRGSFVAEVLDADVDAPTPWMATEYVDGVSLQAAVTRRGRLDGPMLAGLAGGLANALVAVHAADLVHRDLKPSNVLLAWDGPRIIDFGIARALDATSHTTTGGVLGTVAWMSPEQLRGERAGPPADMFAWAMCVVFAARGRHPFPADAPAVSAIRVLQDDPDLTGVPEHLLPLLSRALAKEPSIRPTAVEAVSSLAGVTITSPAEADVAARAMIGTGWVAPTPPGVVAPPAGVPRHDQAHHDQPRHDQVTAAAPVAPAPLPAAGPGGGVGGRRAGRRRGGRGRGRRPVLAGLTAGGLALAALAAVLVTGSVGASDSGTDPGAAGGDARLRAASLKDMAPPPPDKIGSSEGTGAFPGAGSAKPTATATATGRPATTGPGAGSGAGSAPTSTAPVAPARPVSPPVAAPPRTTPPAPRLPPTKPLYRYYNGKDHASLTTGAPAGFRLEHVLGEVYTTGGVPGTVALYTCLNGAESFTSLSADCENRTLVGRLGWVYARNTATPATPATRAVTRCRIGSDHFDSLRADCEGQLVEGRMGFALVP